MELPRHIIGIDTETGGLSHQADEAALLSIGVCPLDNLDDAREYNLAVPKRMKVYDEAAAINGYVSSTWKGELAEDIAMRRLRDYVARLTGGQPWILVAMNPRHDLAFLEAAQRRTGVDLNLGYRSIDLHTMAYEELCRRGEAPDPTTLSSSKVYAAAGLPPEPKPHRALTGAIGHAAIYTRLRSGGVDPHFWSLVTGANFWQHKIC